MPVVIPWRAIETARVQPPSIVSAKKLKKYVAMMLMRAMEDDENPRLLGLAVRRAAGQFVGLWPSIGYGMVNAITCVISQDWKWRYDDIDDVLRVKRPGDKQWGTVRVDVIGEMKNEQGDVKNGIVFSLVYICVVQE